MLGHTIWRSFLLIALGIFLRSMFSPMTNYTFEDTLTQIGMGYTFLFLLAFLSPRKQWIALGVILFGYWLAWALYPAPGPGFDYAAVGVPADWHHNFSGFASHWNKNSNLGNAVDQWFLNLFPREAPFIDNDGGYLTLSFIPTLGTMILGLAAGRWFRESAPVIPIKRFVAMGAALIATALLLHALGVGPIVKRIWTPSWVLFSGGMCFLLLAAFSEIIDVKGYRKWAFPLVVVGMNSIAAYLIAHMRERFVLSSLAIHLGHRTFQVLGDGAGAAADWNCGTDDLLAHAPVAVSQEDLPANLTDGGQRKAAASLACCLVFRAYLNDAHHVLILRFARAFNFVEPPGLLLAARIPGACVELQKPEVGGVVVRADGERKRELLFRFRIFALLHVDLSQVPLAFQGDRA